MDGRFMPNLSFAADVVAAYRGSAELPFEAHLMVEDPDPWLQPFVLDQVDVLLVMTVNPGFSGQTYLPAMEPKVAEARRRIERTAPPTLIEVDGYLGRDRAGRGAGRSAAAGGGFGHPRPSRGDG